MINDLLEPLKVYNNIYKDKFKQASEEYFDDLVVKSKIDIEANRKTIKDYKNKLKLLEQTNKSLKRKIAGKVWLIILIVVLALVALFSWFYFQGEVAIPLLLTIHNVAVDVGLIILICKVINKIIKNLRKNQEDLQNQIDKLKNLGYSQLSTLNALYDWNIPGSLINSTNDIIKMDKYFDVNKFHYMKEKFGLSENTQKNISSCFVQSGTILGNPFMICNDYTQNFIDHTYTGSITIHWTERVRTKDGWKTVHKSQVLTASLVKPVPNYYYETYLLYGNVAAPKLTFSRVPTNSDELNEKQIDKKVRKENKKLDKKAKQDLMDNDPKTNYQRFGNDEFEVLFGGTNRNNELEYRLLFTPLAQRNLLELIKNPKPYGDDFEFKKNKMINIIKSEHSQKFDYKADPRYFIDFDYDNAKTKFINYLTKYFESLYFDLLPLISIPLYQQTKTVEYIYNETFETNMTSYEHEVMANSFNRSLLKHKDSVTDAILKTKFIKKVNNADIVEIEAHSFYKVSHTELIPRHGGDGRTHMVPVVWYEYIPLVNKTSMMVKDNNTTRYEYNGKINNQGFKNLISTLSSHYNYERGIFASLLKRIPNEDDVSNINTYIANSDIINKDNKVEKVIKEIVK